MNFENLIQILCTLHGGLARKVNQVKLGSELKHKPKSRMRKSRTSGSQRSSGRQRPLFT
jgi:hypothetical protein